jgi:ubiquinone/menaquinone biosynthesis C-methylase UbiE
MIRKYFPEKIRILDMGCGDGTYTLEIHRTIRPSKITGFDVAEEAVQIARNKSKTERTGSVKFDVADVYELSKKYHRQEFDLGVFRGVLHHLDNPQKAIREVSKIIDNVMVLEPNGYNPILKLIEKLSPYHRRHGEKSYWPRSMEKWFEDCGYRRVTKMYFSIVPYFCPEFLTKILKGVEPVFEAFPFINRFYCGGILYLFRKK